MARTDALSIYTDSNTCDKLAEIQGFVIDTIQKNAVSEKMKNNEYSGDPAAGSVEIDRFKNAQVDNYGTRRAAGAGVLRAVLGAGRPRALRRGGGGHRTRHHAHRGARRDRPD